jgi:hypothetical protein
MLFNKSRVSLKFGFMALILGFIAGFISAIYLESTGFMLLETKQPCFKYIGEDKDSFCDSKGNLHFYFKGNKDLEKGWYTTSNSSKCVPCNQLMEAEKNEI